MCVNQLLLVDIKNHVWMSKDSAMLSAMIEYRLLNNLKPGMFDGVIQGSEI